MAGIYIHVPFCKQACTYCDFHFSTSLANKDALIFSMLYEIEQRHSYLSQKVISSIYLGGGTPSLLSEQNLDMLFNELRRHFSWEKSIEITLEANPDDINPLSLSVWKKMGINRLSIGLQSFLDEELRWMNRAHTAEESLSSVKLAQDAGYDNITIDLIYGSKFQSPQSWTETLQKAVALNTQHISAYNLTIESKTVLGTHYNKGKEPAVNEELSSMQFLQMREVLRASGFVHYEISNFGKEGFFAKHNSNYWLGKHYLGIGPSAHSFNGLSRQWNVKNNAQYIKQLREGKAFFETENLSLNDKYNEYVLTRLRTIWGCDAREMELIFGVELVNHFKQGILLFKEFFEEENEIYRLNERGKLQADGIASDLFML